MDHTHDAHGWIPIGNCGCCGMAFGTDAHIASTCTRCQSEERSANRRIR